MLQNLKWLTDLFLFQYFLIVAYNVGIKKQIYIFLEKKNPKKYKYIKLVFIDCNIFTDF